MATPVILDGDKLTFPAKFGANDVSITAIPVIHGSGEANILSKKICIVGDEQKVILAATYTKPPYMVSGNGEVTIQALASDQQAEFATAQQPIIVAGSQFTAQFEPTVPAKTSKGESDSDLTAQTGKGSFNNSQSFVTAG